MYMPHPRTPAVTTELMSRSTHHGSPSSGCMVVKNCPPVTVKTASTPTCQYTRRVAIDTAASTAGPAASPDRAPSAPVASAIPSGHRRRHRTSTSATRPSAMSTASQAPCQWSGTETSPIALMASTPTRRKNTPHRVTGGCTVSGAGRSMRSVWRVVRRAAAVLGRARAPTLVGRHPCRGPMLRRRGLGRMVGMIKVEGLSRAYGKFMAVDDISFVCKPGTVTGFLGPNGAGKTTTMRVMVGLTSPTAGEVTIGGLHFHDIPNPGRHVGVLLDASAQHAGRTGREVLTIGAKTMGLPISRVDEMLALVSLDDTESKRRVRNYSLGMRQRLGIAHALLGDPSVLILDEPANGLDPAGIRWMRGLLKGYADRGGTVLLSSHLLHEVEQIADEMILIGNGKIVARGTREELLSQASTGGVHSFATALDNDALAAALTAKGITVASAGEGLRVESETVDVGRAALE